MNSERMTAKARTSQRWLTAFVLSLLLVTQWLSLTHAVTHATRSCSQIETDAHCQERSATEPRGSWIGTVLGTSAHHDDASSLCRLLDHLCHAAPAPSLPETTAQTSAYPLPHVAKIGRWVSPPLGHYRSRAPPTLS